MLLGAAALALGWNLGGHRLLDPDEGRNAEIAREMMTSNDYVIPHLNGLPYLDKPIVYFAAAAVVMEVLGPTETAARLPAYVATLATIALLVAFARRRWGADAGWLAGIALATMTLPLAYARTTIFDSTLTLCTTAAILALWGGRPVLAWAAIGLGAITKGPVAIAVPLLAVVPWAIAVKRPGRPVVTVAALAAFAAVALPWFVAVSARHPDFPHYVFVRETLERVTTGGFRRTGPPYYYLPVILLGAFPWIVPALARARRWRDAWHARRLDPAAADALLLAAWVLVPLMFFTLNQSKLPQYMLPVMPAFALAAGWTLSRDARGGAPAYPVIAAALGLGLAALPRLLPDPIGLTAAQAAAVPPFALAVGIVLVTSAAGVAVAARRGPLPLVAAAYALPVAAIPFIAAPLLTAVGEDRSAAAVTRAVAAVIGDSGRVVGVAAYPPALPFYLRRPILVATPSGRELTSNYIAAHVEQFRALPGSPLRPAGYWRQALSRCTVPTVFITRTGNREARAELGAALPEIAEGGRYAAYGPC